LKELDEEAAGLRRMFQGLKKTQDVAPQSAESTPAKRKRKKMSPAARQAVGERMKLYWAKKRGEAPREAPAEVAGKAEEEAPATTTPVAKKKPTKNAKKASRVRKAKGKKSKRG
jgi:hypothetical protein